MGSTGLLISDGSNQVISPVVLKRPTLTFAALSVFVAAIPNHCVARARANLAFERIVLG